jgi:hypothetical protein
MRTNYSHQTKDSLLLEYTYRIEALVKKIEELQIIIKKSQKNGQRKNR